MSPYFHMNLFPHPNSRLLCLLFEKHRSFELLGNDLRLHSYIPLKNSSANSWWTWLMLLDVDEDVAACWYIYTWSSKQPSFSWMEMVIFQPFFPFVKVFGSSNLKRHKPSQTNGKGAFGRSRSPDFLRKNPVPKFHQSLQHPESSMSPTSVVGYPLVNSHNSGISEYPHFW